MQTKAAGNDPYDVNGDYVARLDAPLPVELVDEFLSKLHYVSEFLTDFELTVGRDAVRYRISRQANQHSPIISKRILEVAQKLSAAHRPFEPVIVASRQKPVTFHLDPHPLLEAQGDLLAFGQGRYGFGPRLLELINFFDGQLFQRADRFRAVPYQFPTLIGADIMDRCRYLRTFPHSLSLVSHLREDLEVIQDFARTTRWQEGSLACDFGALAAIECLLSPNVCFHCYASLRDTVQSEPRAFVAVGKCFRYESGNLDGLERLWDFTMREWIFVGTKEYALASRQEALEETVALLHEWDMDYEIKSANDPVAVDEYSIATFQLAFDLKYEIQATLPYKRKSLAVGSLNFHQDFFGRALNIKTDSDSNANMACAAFGLERLTLAFLAQHGLSRKQWPVAVSDRVKGW